MKNTKCKNVKIQSRAQKSGKPFGTFIVEHVHLLGAQTKNAQSCTFRIEEGSKVEKFAIFGQKLTKNHHFTNKYLGAQSFKEFMHKFCI